jgi:hypothetical protein
MADSNCPRWNLQTKCKTTKVALERASKISFKGDLESRFRQAKGLDFKKTGFKRGA